MSGEMTFYNTGNQLTFSADGVTYGYLGRASPAGITQPGTDPTYSRMGSSVYTFYWPGDIIVVLPVKNNGPTCLQQCGQDGNGNWTITVFKANNGAGGNSLGLETQEYTEVYVFGAPYPGVNSAFMLYDGNGNPSGDLTRTPLTVQAVLYLPGDPASPTWTPPFALNAPGIIGAPPGYRTTSGKKNTTTWINRTYGYGWYLEASGNITRQLIGNEYMQDDGGIAVVNQVQPVTALVTSVAGL